MTSNKLITFGCSLTYGQALENRMEQSWPAQLGKLLDLETDNQGVRGSSAKRIWWDCINYKFKLTDIVVICWTHKDRWCLIKSPTNTEQYEEWDIDEIADMKGYLKVTKNLEIENFNQWQTENNPKGKMWYKHFHNDFDMIVNYFALVNHANYFLQNKVKKVYHLSATENNYPIPVFNETKFLNAQLHQIRKQFPPALDGWHPGPEAMEEYAKHIHKEIMEESIE